jgi:hypothetical protein
VGAVEEPRRAAETIKSFTVATGTPNPLGDPIHDRMPVILDPERGRIRKSRCASAQIGTRVGNVKDGEAGLIDPVAVFAVRPRSPDLVVPMQISHAKLKTYLIGTLTVVGPIAAIVILVALGFR